MLNYMPGKNVSSSPLFALCAAFFAALLCSLFAPIFIYACVLIGLIGIVALPVNQVFCFLLFAFPYANLVASNVDSTSLFLLLEFAAVAVVLFLGDIDSEPRKALGSFVALCRDTIASLLKGGHRPFPKGYVRAIVVVLFDTVICIIKYGLNSVRKSLLKLAVALALIVLTTVDTIGNLKYILLLAKILGLFYLFVLYYRKKDSKKYSFFFMLGMLTSSVLGAFKTIIPRLLTFFPDLNYESINGVYVPRFSGINPDPNHYAIPLMLCITVCLFSLLRKGFRFKERWPVAVLLLVFVLFGAMTMSKSFFILLIITGLVAVVTLAPKDILKKAIPILIIVVAAFLIIPNPLVSNIMYRFLNLTDTNVSLLNGREAIWGTYITEISSSLSIFLFGHGLQAPLVNGRASHNIFIEAIYRIGLFGMVTWIGIIVASIRTGERQKRHKIVNYWGFMLLVVQYFLLSGLTVYDYAYYLMISYVIYTNSLTENEAIA